MTALITRINTLYARIPNELITLVARFSIAAVFWKSGQTKVENFAVDLFDWNWRIGWPHFSDSVVGLFRDEYHLPLLPPEVAAFMAAGAEHVFSTLILIGLVTRLSATALLFMTLTIEILVYPDAYPTHGVWAANLLFLMKNGAGALSLDRLALNWFGRAHASVLSITPAAAPR